jgi:RNA polymerase sigma factor (sigma-70 family)
MDEARTTIIIQRYLDALPGDTAAEPIVRELLEQAAGRLRLLCATFPYKSYPRLTGPPVNLETDELLGGVVAGLLTALRTTRPPTVRRFLALANQHMRWQLNDLASRLDERPTAAELTKTGLAALPSSTAFDLSPDGRRMLEVIEDLPEDEREVFDLVGIQGLTHVEVAMVVGVSEKTVQRRLNRARLLLAERLTDLRPATSCELTPPLGDALPALRKVPMASNPQVLELLEEMLNSGKTPEEVCRDCLELLPEVRQRWQEFQLIDVQIRTSLPGLGTGPRVGTTAPPGSVPAIPAAALPAHVGRYRVERLLGEGSFGRVYLARDEQLQRPVAIKVPHAHLVAQADDAEPYLAEARTVASLDHPNIVPVFDVGNTEPFPCYVVSKFIDGSNLTAKVQASPLSLEACAELVATVAEALHYAHKQGIVHRDIKPGNLLLDRSGKPFLADFGVALREPDVGKGPRYAGTPDYMSPEQARARGIGWMGGRTFSAWAWSSTNY